MTRISALRSAAIVSALAGIVWLPAQVSGYEH